MQDIAQRFFNIDTWLGETPIGSGNINDTYRIDFEHDGKRETYLLQRLNHLVFRQPEAVMQNICRVTAHLQQAGFAYASPAPVAALDGQFFQKIGENYWRCFPFLENTYAPEGQADAQIAFEAARAYGAFARALRDFPTNELAETIPGFHDTDRRWEVFLKNLEADPVGRVAGSQAEIQAMFLAKPVFDQVSFLKKSGALPLRVTHNDTKAGNVLFDHQTHRAVAVIDLDTVMPGVILSDFGDMVRTFVPDKKEDEPSRVTVRAEMLEALTEGFLAETSEFLNETERANLLLGGAWITGEQALRFLTDWLAGDVYYKIQHPEHNLVRSRNQLALFEALSAYWQT